MAASAFLVAVVLAGTSLGRPLLSRGLAFIGFALAAQDSPPTSAPVAPSPDTVVPIFYSALGPDNDELHLLPGTHRLMIRASMGDPDRVLSFSLVRLDTSEQMAAPIVQNRRPEFFEVTVEPGEYNLLEASFPKQPVRITVSE